MILQRFLIALVVAGLAGAVAVAGCGGGNEPKPRAGLDPSQIVAEPTPEEPALDMPDLGFPETATKNTTRVSGSSPAQDAAAAALAIYPSTSSANRPSAVVLVDQGDWTAAAVAAVLSSSSVRAPLLFSQGGKVPESTAAAVERLGPTGSKQAKGVKLIRVGSPVPDLPNLKAVALQGRDPAELAATVDAFSASAGGGFAERVQLVTQDSAEFALPAVAWAAKSGDPILFVESDSIPDTTRKALARHNQPEIYLVGPNNMVTPQVMTELQSLGTVVQRVGASNPISSAVSFARYRKGLYGWGVTEPGHGLVFANLREPMAAVAGAGLSAAGSYGPLILLDEADAIPEIVRSFLLDIQPGYFDDPAKGVYNHGWIIGDPSWITVRTQGELDELLEIQPVNTGKASGTGSRP